MRSTYRNARAALFFPLAITMPFTGLLAQDVALFEAQGALNTTAAPRTHKPTDHLAPGPIHDDGETEKLVPTATQLMVACADEHGMALTLDILNERGHVVRHHVLAPTQGQHFWAVDVDDLRAGRYVARVTCARGAVVNRFRRE